MARGTVKWFSGEKGFGFVEAEGGESLLVHFTEISGDGFRSLEGGAKVEFETSKDGLGRPVAANVREVAEGDG
ncbi:MAG: cold shock domain-containing protein [Rubrobacter sp.]|jgi:CspA family cold shock protein|nr:cold shock domain-containing protein [Rubrobacter sp.]